MQVRLNFIFVVFIILFFSNCEIKKASTDLNAEHYSKLIANFESEGFTTGNILIYEKGEVIFQSSKGLRTFDPKDSLTLASQFRLASVSKQFTGMAIMKLKQFGKIEYDQNVNTILSDFPYDNITIKHLLHHTSGIDDYIEVIDKKFKSQDYYNGYILGNEEILDIFYDANLDLKFQPGENYEYSNTGYLVLASIVEKISNQHFRDFLNDNFFEPLDMYNTKLYDYKEGYDSNMPNRVFGYRETENKNEYELNDYDIVNGVRGDGGIYSTLEDLYKWNMALVNYRVIPKEYLNEGWTSGKLNNGENISYGFGWVIDDDLKHKTVSHNGGWLGFGTHLYNEIDTKSGYIILTNDSSDTAFIIKNKIDDIRSSN